MPSTSRSSPKVEGFVWPDDSHDDYTDLRLGSDPRYREGRMRRNSKYRDPRGTPSERDPAVDKELEHSLSRAVKGAVANHTDSFW